MHLTQEPVVQIPTIDELGGAGVERIANVVLVYVQPRSRPRAELRRHRNAHEVHRELGRTPNAAARAAQREGRSALRPVQRCPWWPYIWSVRTPLKVGPDGRVPVGHQRLRVGVSAGTRVIHCQHPSDTISILAHEPKAGERPALLLQVRTP